MSSWGMFLFRPHDYALLVAAAVVTLHGGVALGLVLVLLVFTGEELDNYF